MSQETLAEKAGISPNTASRIECGLTAMSIEIFRELEQIWRLLSTDLNEMWKVRS